MQLPNLTLAAKLGVGAVAALALAGGGAAVGARLAGSTSTVSAPAPIVASPATQASPAPTATANQAGRAVSRAMLDAEAQVLGLQPAQLTADLRKGIPVEQLAAGKGLDQAQFQAQFLQALKPLLDQDVTAGTLTSTEEQKALRRLTTAVPNWSQARPARAASPSPPAQ